jgi:hypothetical protein
MTEPSVALVPFTPRVETRRAPSWAPRVARWHRFGLSPRRLAAFARPIAALFGLVVAAGIGWAGANMIQPAPAPVVAKEDPFAVLGGQIKALSADVKATKEQIATMRAGLVRPKVDETKALRERVAAIGDNLDKLKQDTAQRLSQLGQTIESRDGATKLAQIAERLDRIEKQTATLTTGSLPAKADGKPAETKPADIKPAEAAPQLKPIAGYVLRDVYQGLALVESRRGMMELAPGDTYAELGRIEKIERRNGAWTVVTSKGLIQPPQRTW